MARLSGTTNPGALDGDGLLDPAGSIEPDGVTSLVGPQEIVIETTELE
jgi:hypothetical protein